MHRHFASPEVLDLLEKIQQRATKTAPEIRELSCREKMTAKDFILKMKRVKGNLIVIFKVLIHFEFIF